MKPRTKLKHKILFVNLETGTCEVLRVGPQTLYAVKQLEHIQILQEWDVP